MGQRNLKDDGDYFMFYKVTGNCEVHGDTTWYSWEPFYLNDNKEYICSATNFGFYCCQAVLTNLSLVNVTRLEIADAPKTWQKHYDDTAARKLISEFDGTPIERASQIISLANAMKRLAEEMEDWPDDWFERNTADFHEITMKRSSGRFIFVRDGVEVQELPKELRMDDEPPDEIPDVREANVERKKGWNSRRTKALRSRSSRSHTGEIAGLGRDNEWTLEYEEWCRREHDDPR